MKNVSRRVNLCLTVVMLAVLMSCGVKGNPVGSSPGETHSRAIGNLTVTSSGDHVVLTWTLRDEQSRIRSIGIERMEYAAEDAECRNCAEKFEGIGRLDAGTTGQARKSFEFVDKNVTHGKSYGYRLSLCDEFDECFNSAVTEVYFLR